MKAFTRPGDPGYIVPGSKEYAECIGCSEVATILGHGYEQPKDLWLRKTHRKPDPGHKLIFDRGHDMEPIMARRLVQEYGRKLTCEQVQYRDPERPWLIYHADGVFPKWSPLNDGAKPLEGPGIWEAKAPGSHVAAEMMRDGMSSSYVCQGQLGMYVASAALDMPIAWATYGFLEYDSYELIVFDCARSQEFIDAALPMLEAFYDCMVRDVPPEPIFPQDRPDPPFVKGELEIIPDGELPDLAERLKRLREDVLVPGKLEEDGIKARMKELLDDYEKAEVPGVMRFSYKYGQVKEAVKDPMGLLAYCEHLVNKYNADCANRDYEFKEIEFRRSDWVEVKAPSRTFRPTIIKER